MPVQIKRLHLASLRGPDGLEWPVHGFVVTHPGGAALVDTGVGGPPQVLSDWRVVNRSVADALAGLDMTPGDIGLVINAHLHFDHCGQNPVFKHGAHYVQRAELERARREATTCARAVATTAETTIVTEVKRRLAELLPDLIQLADEDDRATLQAALIIIGRIRTTQPPNTLQDAKWELRFWRLVPNSISIPPVRQAGMPALQSNFIQEHRPSACVPALAITDRAATSRVDRPLS